ncbi:MAG: sigma-70 family RNA polymerase sigma factor [Anaerolineales bacterium]
MPEVVEREWIRRAQAGDTEAFGYLVNEHQRFVYHLALRTLSDPHEAEDVAQEAFVRAWLALPNFRGQARFATWLYRIVTNLCFNRLPRLRRELNAIGDDALPDVRADAFDSDPSSGLELAQRRAFLHAEIERLPESYKLLVTLRFQRELPYEDIASITGLPLGTVKTGLFRARARLREALRNFEEVTV